MLYPNIPKNNLTPYIEKLVNTCKILLEDEGEGYNQESFKFSSSVTEEEINCWEKENNISIPTSYKEWLMFSNGVNLCNSMVELYSLNDLIVDNEKKPYNVPDDFVVVGEFTEIEETYCFSCATGAFKVFREYEEIEVADFRSILGWINDRIG